MAMIPTLSAGNSNRTTYKVIKPGLYPARLVRFAGLGVHPQRPYQGQPKPDAFKVSLQWELFTEEAEPMNAIEIKDGAEVVTERPSCVFQDITVRPGVERGKAFDLCTVFDPEVKKVPADMDYFFGLLGQAAMIQVTQYESPKGSGNYRNSVGNFSPMPKMMLKMLPQMRSQKVGFDPYSETQENKVAYSMLFPFQRTMLTEAKDAKFIPLAGSEPIKLEGVNEKAQQPIIDEEVPFDVAPMDNPFL